MESVVNIIEKFLKSLEHIKYLKCPLVFLLILGSCQTASAQISLRFLDQDGQGIPGARVLLVKLPDSVEVGAALTDEKGVVSIGKEEGQSLEQGSYVLKFNYIGFQNWHSAPIEISTAGKGIDLGTQLIKQNTRRLKEVVVNAQRSLYHQNAEGTVINVESSILSKGSTALQVLERSPGVIIDHHNANISLGGKSGVMVMMNGKLVSLPIAQVLDLLNGMNAEDIEKIELLSSPPAKYDAEGSAGLINIVLKRSKKRGTNGTFSLTGGYGYREKASGSLHLSHNSEHIDVYGSYSYIHDHTRADLSAIGSEYVPVFASASAFNYHSDLKFIQNNHSASFGLDARPDSSLNMGASLNLNISSSSNSAFTTNTYQFNPDSTLLLNAGVNGVNQWQNVIASAYLEKQMHKHQKLNFNFDYLYYHNNSPSTINTEALDKNGQPAVTTNDSVFSPVQHGFASTSIKVAALKADYSKEWSPALKLEAGIKGSFTKDRSTSGIQSLINGDLVDRSGTANTILMHEKIGAAYVSFNTKPDSLITLNVGLRYEYSDQHMLNPEGTVTNIDRRLSSLFPSIFFSRKLNENSELQASFTRRISRPTYNDLASYVQYSDAISVLTGNPYLFPTITTNLKFGYTHSSYSFSVLFSRDQFPIAEYQVVSQPGSNLIYVSPVNVNYQNNISLQTNIPLQVNKIWSMNFNFSGGWRQFEEDFTPEPVKKSYLGYSANVIETVKLPSGISAELSALYNSYAYTGVVKNLGVFVLNFGLKEELKNNWGTIQLSLTDLLRTTTYKNDLGVLTNDAFNSKVHIEYKPESALANIIKLSYTKSFGSVTVRGQKSHEASSPEEKDRIK